MKRRRSGPPKSIAIRRAGRASTHVSPDAILRELRKAATPLDVSELARRLKLHGVNLSGLDTAIVSLERAGSVMRNRKGALCLVDRLDLIRGKVQGHPDGFGFLIRDDGAPDCFIGPREMRKCLHGDRVMAREMSIDRRGRVEVAIVEVLDRESTSIVGRVHSDHGILTLEPVDKRINQAIVVAPGGMSARVGQVVVAELIAQPPHDAPIAGRIVEVLGDYADPGMEIEIALRKHKLPYRFSHEALREAESFPEHPGSGDAADRVDLRGLALITIDGESARDFDDAVYCESCAAESRLGGFRLIVAIADVSHYVAHGGHLDHEAALRGNSVYFPRRVIPMLPEKLSNGLCSLNPDVDRLCVACDMRIGARGRIDSFHFYNAIMRSRARLTYTRVAAYLAGDRNGVAADVARNLDTLAGLFQALARARTRRGAIDFETTETKLIFDDERKIKNIVRVERNDAHRVIEESMLAANVCASTFLKRHRHPMLYRIHEGPTPEKLATLRAFLSEFGLTLTGGEDPRALDYANLLTSIKTRRDAQLLQTVLLRSLQQAVYSPENAGHFGLAYESYTHFTSPIRRYPDLLVHRAIKAALTKQRYRPGDWAALGAHCSLTERCADDATRDVVSWLKCYYMRDRVGESFDGSISAVTGFGIFVALDDIYVEGLVHVSELGNDYYHFDAARHQLFCARTKRRFRLADRVHVKLVRVDLERMRIDFTLDE